MTHKQTLVFDIEADNLLLDVTRIWCIVAMDLATGEIYRYTPDNIGDGVRHLESAYRLIGHNARMFDGPALAKVWKAKLPPIVDTILMSRVIYPDQYANPVGGHGLEEWGTFLKQPKGDYSDWSRFTKEMLEYCVQDVRVTAAVYKYLAPRAAKFPGAIKLEHQVADIICRQIQNGMTLNHDAVHKLTAMVSIRAAELHDELVKIFPPRIETLKTPQYYLLPDGRRFRTKTEARKAKSGEPIDGPLRTKEHQFNPGSTAQVAERLIEKYGWKPKDLTDTGKPKMDEKVLSRLPYPEAQKLLEFRLVAKKESQAQEWLEHVRPNGRVHGDVITNGTVTGRMSHSKPNMGQIPKIQKNKPFGRECRACFGPRPGWWQVGADASSLEARMLANRLWRWDNGEYAKIVLEGDVHQVNADILGITRDAAKNWFYAFMYGAGSLKLGIMAGATTESAAIALGKSLNDRFRKGIPAFGHLLDWVRGVAKKDGFIVALDGRHIPIRSKHSALNTLLQSDGAIVMKLGLVLRDSMIRAHIADEDWGDMANVHDEWQSEAATLSLAKMIGEFSTFAIQESGKKLGIKVPLAGEYKVGRSWADCH